MPGRGAKPGLAPALMPARGLVGCIGRRPAGPPGCGRPAGACGRGRWKMGWPGIGRPGVRMGWPGVLLAAGVAGARYTGRGPVCGMIMRRTGSAGRGGCAGGATVGVAVAAGGCAVAAAGLRISAGLVGTIAGATGVVAGADAWICGIAAGTSMGGRAAGCSAVSGAFARPIRSRHRAAFSAK